MAGKLRISLEHQPLVVVTRSGVWSDKLVYVVCASKPIKYEWGKSRIVYIGTTKNGLSRVAASVADCAQDLLSDWGVHECHAHVVTCDPRPRVKSWQKLERTMIIAFRDQHREPPAYNGTGHNMQETDEFEYFSRDRIENLLAEFDD
jgi:hypothetical protein